MIECPRCGFRNPDGTEFCKNPSGCGAFLGYEVKKLDALPGGVLLTLSPGMVAVAPGGQASAEIRVRNKSNVVDQYEIRISGLPSAWAVVSPGTISLFPDKEASATVWFRPPRASDVSGGRQPFVIDVQSKASPQTSARQDGVVEVAAFQETGLAITPRTARGGDSAIYRLAVQNKGNAPAALTLDATDPDELLLFEFDRPTLMLGSGEAANVQLVVRPRATFYDGPPQPHGFKVQLAGGGAAPLAAEATFLQEPVPRPVPRKFPVVPVLLAVLLLGVVTGAIIERDPLMTLVSGKSPSTTNAPNTGGGKASPPPSSAATPSPTPSATATPVLAQIPNVTCMTASVAQQAIEGAGFKFAGSFVANSNYANGVVFKTQPVPGEAPLGTEVTAFVSTGPPPGIVLKNQCLSIIHVLPSGILKLLASPTPPP